MPEPRIVITSGEPAGIGPDIIAGIKPENFKASLVVIGDRELLQSRTQALGSSIRFCDDADTAKVNSIQLIHQPLISPCVAGELDSRNAAYVLSLLRRAGDGCLQGEFDAMVTAPVHKEVINRAGVAFTGHTEFLADLCNAKPLMLLTSERLKVALVTTHLPLRDVADAITGELIIEIASILDRELQRRFGIDNPHIKVCGLNPHAGESGVLGREEIEIIIPAIETLKKSGMNLSGPYPADTLFTPSMLSDADVVLAMYHDQGLPVLKYASFGKAVNVTLGLPIVRTSVDHGTALDIAGSGTAEIGSMLAAIELAARMASR